MTDERVDFSKANKAVAMKAGHRRRQDGRDDDIQPPGSRCPQRFAGSGLDLLHRLGEEAAAKPDRVDRDRQRARERSQPHRDDEDQCPDQVRHGPEQCYEPAGEAVEHAAPAQLAGRQDRERATRQYTHRGPGQGHLEGLDHRPSDRRQPLDARWPSPAEKVGQRRQAGTQCCERPARPGERPGHDEHGREPRAERHERRPLDPGVDALRHRACAGRAW